jgi:hypothetical protein
MTRSERDQIADVSFEAIGLWSPGNGKQALIESWRFALGLNYVLFWRKPKNEQAKD